MAYGMINDAVISANYQKFFISQSDAGREQVIKISASAGILTSELLALTKALGNAGGDGTGTDQNGPDAFTIAAVGTATGLGFKDVSGAIVTDDGIDTAVQVIFLRVQGTGTVDLAGLKAAAEGANANATTFTVTVEAVFAPRF